MALIERRIADRPYGDDCWEWPYATISKGYAQIALKGRPGSLVHRYVMARLGHDIDGKIVRHLCGNGHLACWNPNHLAVGSVHDNAMDMCRHGRATTKLTPEQVQEIRRSHEPFRVTQRMLAERFGVHRDTIDAILNGRTWYWLPTDEVTQ